MIDDGETFRAAYAASSSQKPFAALDYKPPE
jgi:hypothetical protein